MNKTEVIEELLSSRRIENFEGKPNIYPSKEEARKRLAEDKQLRIYLGIDPTGPDLHLGHSIPLLFLKQLLILKHRPVLVIGDFTARVGDPTGKSTTRKSLSENEIKNNMKNYLKIVRKILPEGSFDVEYNSSWSAKMTLDKFFELASNLTVQQLTARSMFRERIESGNPLALNEFLYPVMQGYDSVAMNIDGEVGGNDQVYNMLVGRDLMKKILNKEKLVFGLRLIVDAVSKKKMSKSEGSLISLSDSPFEIFSKIMAHVPDRMIKGYFELCTEKEQVWIEKNATRAETDPLEFKKELGQELVKMYHSEKEAKEAKAEWEKVFSNKEKPSEISEVKVKSENIVDVLVETKLAASKSEAKRLIEQNGVKIDDETATESTKVKSGSLIQVGKRKFIKIK